MTQHKGYQCETMNGTEMPSSDTIAALIIANIEGPLLSATEAKWRGLWIIELITVGFNMPPISKKTSVSNR